MNKHHYELRQSGFTFYGSVKFTDKAHSLKVTMTNDKWVALGQPDSVWVAVEAEGDVHAIQ